MFSTVIRSIILICLLGLTTLPTQAQDLAVLSQTDVYTSGTDGYAIYRIPTMIQTTSGTLLAFAEGRKHSGSDTGQIDTVLRRSHDGGATWSPLELVRTDGDHTCGNPVPVIDKRTGRIVLVTTWNRGDDHEKDIMAGTSKDTRRVFVTHSDDDGRTWSTHKDITDQVKKPHWRWYATGPCHGIQLDSGRLVIPANYSDHTHEDDGVHPYSAHVIFSDDGGDTWQMGGSPGPATNESTVVALNDGTLMLNMRSYHDLNRRAVSWSHDDGATWNGVYLHPQLIEPVCQASILRLSNGHLVFSNPASTAREKLTVRLSTDSGATWTSGTLLHEEFSAYSDLVELPDGSVGCLYERDSPDEKRYGRITFARLGATAPSAAP